jgi:rhomboid protease GluP
VRKTTGAILCPSCRKLISVSEPKCPFCGRLEPGLWGFTPGLTRLLGGLDPTALIAAAAIVLYVVALAIDWRAALAPRGIMSLLAPSSRALFTLGMTGGLAWTHGHWWTLLSATFLHGGILHIVFNVYWIRSLGPAVEEIYGPARTFIIFVVAGAAGFLLSNVLSGAPTIGASGAVFGLLGALLAHGRRAGRSLMTRQIWSQALILFLFGFLMPGVNNYAHGGGFAGGYAAAVLLGAGVGRREGPGTQVLAFVAALLSLAAVLYSAFTFGPVLFGAR